MTIVLILLGIPLISAALLALISDYRLASRINVAASLATLGASLGTLAPGRLSSLFFLLDDLNVPLVIVTAFVAFTTSTFSASYIRYEVDSGRVQPSQFRFYHAMFQAFVFTLLLALVANNLGFLWVAVEGATLATALMVSLYRTHAAIEAAWKYFILCGVGIALALFGTILIYLAAQPVMGAGLAAMSWVHLLTWTTRLDPVLLNLAFVFLLTGYGTKVGLAPLHAWLPDAHAEGPTPISAVLSGLLLNVALYAVLRFKMLLSANGDAIAPGPLMMGMGLTSLVLGSVMLYRRRDIKRLFAYSSIEHMGIVTFAFGMGGPIANFAGLLHMVMHSLTKSALFFTVGHIAQVRGTQTIADIRGLTSTHPALGWTLVVGVAAIAGVPPLGIFTSEFLMLSATIAERPLLAAPLVVGLLVAFGALVLRVQGLAFGAPRGAGPKAMIGTLVPAHLHLGLVLVAGLYLPPPVVAWFENIAKLLG